MPKNRTTRTVKWIEYLNTTVVCATLVLVVAVVIGVYSRHEETTTLTTTPSTLSVVGQRPQGRTVIIPMGYYYGTYVMHLWLRTYQRPFRMRVDTGSSIMLFGDLPGCIDGSSTVCESESGRQTHQVTFAEAVPIEVSQTLIRAHTISMGFIDGVPRVESIALRARVADDTRDFILPLGFGGGDKGLMNQLKVRRLQIWLVDQTWSLRMPCQVVLSPSDPVDPKRVLLRVPMVSSQALMKELGSSTSGNTDPTYVFRIDPPAPPASQKIMYAIIDIGSTLSYVPLQNATDRLTENVTIKITGTDKYITLSQQETLPLSTLVNLQGLFMDRVIIIGNRSLNNLVVEVDLDDGATGTLHLLNPS
jgi:hypothetical protein